jgi:Mn-dependent DtxR family transcriptional regulator
MRLPYGKTVPGPEVSDSDDKILREVRLFPGPFVTAGDIEPKLSVGYKQTRNRLDQLVDGGFLNVRKVGTVNLYWLTDEGKRAISSASRSDS